MGHSAEYERERRIKAVSVLEHIEDSEEIPEDLMQLLAGMALEVLEEEDG